MTGDELPRYEDVEAAAERLRGQAVLTPLLESDELNRRTGGRILIKPEVLQRTGSFKFRGAFNRISRIPKGEHSKGVVAYSSGNHAQGVAAAAARLGLPATIVMPADAPAIKLVNTRALGATVLTYDRYRDVREEVAAEVQATTGATLVRPYDDRHVIAGQGTVGLEIVQQARELSLTPDAILACCGGGGLTAGIALAAKALSPETAVYTVEPEGFDDTARSLAAGMRQENSADARSICDALLAPTPGELTFAINQTCTAGGVAVSDAAVRRAMAFAARRLKLVVEPGGAVCLAALLSGRFDAKGKVIAITLSGGNVDDALLAEVLGENED
ncbi:threonine ammonia-lyase [Aquibaculum arenosum]|uniref:Threonine/serine dehydratase n=1 Tax=Aquibaculum arenosum TaxID=3032591 RepID=A0ABT5YK23_9PROT|nr:threonine/serine dehydratase [Fodinicurvata sp. CAU 1616]MDF2095296.1 threonine/serine dehydratase [Fodinicurvata sp. CAU 1616]